MRPACSERAAGAATSPRRPRAGRAPRRSAAAADLALIDRRWRAGGEFADAGERNEEFEDLRELLRDGAPDRDCPALVELAATIARACLGQDHLWHDLGLASREELSRILHAHFPRLAAKNVGRMRWKKFFYKQLCERLEVRACRAPSCGACAQQGECFGSEAVPLARLGAVMALPAGTG
jgi:nitrogen fixation protein NifQ